MQSEALTVRRKVVIIHRIIAPYRVPFYRNLKETLYSRGVDLVVLYGHPRPRESDPYVELDIGTKVPTKYFYVGERFLVWLSALKAALASDLVVVQQANTNLLNYVLILMRLSGRFGFKLAFWGHGKNFQAANKVSFGERFKRYYSKFADYWFAYTDLSAEAIAAIGFPKQNIISVNNAIDTNQAIQTYDSITDGQTAPLRSRFGISEDSPVGIFCSRLYYLKRIDFLLQCLTEIRGQVPGFHFFIIGDGEEAWKIKEFCKQNDSWCHYLGPLYGEDKIRFFKLSQFQLLPGGVGLNIVESFALLAPLFTTRHWTHGPEIAYLSNGINGIMTDDSIESFVEEVVNWVTNPTRLDALVQGCRSVRSFYSTENMAERFAAGIQSALS